MTQNDSERKCVIEEERNEGKERNIEEKTKAKLKKKACIESSKKKKKSLVETNDRNIDERNKEMRKQY